MKQYILSPCGTSLLTNYAKDNNERALIRFYANEKNKNNVPSNDRDQLERLIDSISAKLEQADYQVAIKMSAELNGIVNLYKGTIPSSGDFHLLLSTDTWLGEETAKLVKMWLLTKSQHLIVDVYRHTDLQTEEICAFQLSLSDLVKKLGEELPSYSKNGYKIIFNLTGGFKSVQGFLQSIANFYADETVYIFESSSELLRIPRLPITMDMGSIVEKHITDFRKISLGLPVQNAIHIPEILLFEMDGQTQLSAWGELVWKQSRNILYKQRLCPSPSPEIIFSKQFEKDNTALPDDRLELINHRIDQLAKYLNNNAYNPESLNFKKLSNERIMKPSTHEMDAWHDKDAKRIFGHFEHDQFVLDTLGKGLHH